MNSFNVSNIIDQKIYQYKIILLGDWGIGDWGLGIGDWAQSPHLLVKKIKIKNK